MTESYTIAVTITVKSEHLVEFGERLLADVDETRNDPGCIVFDVHQRRDDPAIWFLYEGWRTKADSDEHMAKPRIRAFLADWPRLLAEAPTLMVLELTAPRSVPKEQWRKATPMENG